MGRIQGKLEAFALASMAANESYGFRFESLDSDVALHESVRHYLDLEAGVAPDSLQITPISEIEAELRVALNNWLFVWPTHPATQDKPNQKMIVDDLIEAITRLAPVCCRVHFSPVKWYECAWDDFVLQGTDGAYFLHLGLSD